MSLLFFIGKTMSKKKNEKTYVTVGFQKIRKLNGKFVRNNSITMSCDDYEQYEKCKSPTTLTELYYCTKIQCKDFPVTRELYHTEVQSLVQDSFPAHDIVFNEASMKQAIYYFTTLFESLRQFLPTLPTFDPNLLPHTVNISPTERTFKHWIDKLDELYVELTEKEKLGRLHIITGKPGTGKTEQTVREILKLGLPVKVVTLSNLVGSNFVNRAKREGYRNITASSYAKEHFAPAGGADVVVFEEASMLGTNELPIVLNNVKQAKYVWFLGDTNQLPTFLGRGNILHGLLEHFLSTRLETNYRCSQEIVDNMNRILSGRLPTIVDCELIMDYLYEFLDDKKDFIVTAYRNNTVEDINKKALFVQLNICNPDLDEDFYRQLLSRPDAMEALVTKTVEYCPIPLICSRQISVKKKDGTYEKLFYTAERAVLTANPDGTYMVKSTFRDGVQSYKDIRQVMKNFQPGYACTIYRTQGLEWDYTLFFNDMNTYLINSNLCYVAYTRSRKKSIIFSDSDYAGRLLTFKDIFRFCPSLKKDNEPTVINQ